MASTTTITSTCSKVLSSNQSTQVNKTGTLASSKGEKGVEHNPTDTSTAKTTTVAKEVISSEAPTGNPWDKGTTYRYLLDKNRGGVDDVEAEMRYNGIYD